MKTWIIPLAVLMVVPALGAAAPIVVAPVPEQLVEGHTVFTVIEQVNATTTNKTQFAAAVAVLVREAIARNVNERFPGVLWFNDQYLVDPVDNSANRVVVRYPCTGSVLAVNTGGQDPRTAFHPVVVGAPVPAYVESYLVTDPNDHTWNVDKWFYTSTTAVTDTIWTVALNGNDGGYNTPDDGTSSCAPYTESTIDTGLAACGPGDGNLAVGIPPGQNPGHCNSKGGFLNSGSPDYPTPGTQCAPGGGGNGCDLRYNAVLFFYLEDLLVAGANKLHHSGAPVAGDDASGCETPKTPEQIAAEPYFVDHWPCPGANDNAEGNSHPYNPFNGLPICPNCVGRNNHGGSAGVVPGTNTGGDGVQYSHATRNIDIYYSFNPAPTVRNYRLIDTEGSTAPFFCEDFFAKCIPGDL